MPILHPGESFQGLRVEHFVGAGSHGEVYFARSLITGELLALKIILASPADERRIQGAIARRGARGASTTRTWSRPTTSASTPIAACTS